MTFAELWSKYPRKVAKKAAEKAYTKTAKTIPHAAIMASLDLMLAGEWKGRAPEFIPHCASWLNRESFDSEDRTELLFDEEPEPVWECRVTDCDFCGVSLLPVEIQRIEGHPACEKCAKTMEDAKVAAK